MTEHAHCAGTVTDTKWHGVAVGMVLEVRSVLHHSLGSDPSWHLGLSRTPLGEASTAAP